MALNEGRDIGGRKEETEEYKENRLGLLANLV